MAQFIDKIRATVRVSLGGSAPLEGTLALAPQARFHDGPETVLELLNARQLIVPFARVEDEAVLLLTRLRIVWVVAGPDTKPFLVCPPTYRVTREERVQVIFVDGTPMDGLIQMELPEDLNRASDFLNGEDDFYPLVTQLGTLLVNKHMVRETHVFESSPLPLTSGL